MLVISALSELRRAPRAIKRLLAPLRQSALAYHVHTNSRFCKSESAPPRRLSGDTNPRILTPPAKASENLHMNGLPHITRNAQNRGSLLFAQEADERAPDRALPNARGGLFFRQSRANDAKALTASRLWRRSAIHWRKSMTASPANFVNRVFFGYQNTATLKAALELDVFTVIGKNSIDALALAMGRFMALDAKLVAERASDPPPRRVLDIAASHGLFGIAFGQRFPKCHITGLDWGAVVTVARENAAAAGMAHRYDTIAGSAFEVDWGKDYDWVLLPNFLHHFDRAACTELLRRARAALAPGGRVAIVEWVPNDDRVSPPVPALFAMTMLLTTPSGSTYTALEMAAMLADAKFATPEIIPLLPTPLPLVLSD